MIAVDLLTPDDAAPKQILQEQVARVSYQSRDFLRLTNALHALQTVIPQKIEQSVEYTDAGRGAAVTDMQVAWRPAGQDLDSQATFKLSYNAKDEIALQIQARRGAAQYTATLDMESTWSFLEGHRSTPETRWILEQVLAHLGTQFTAKEQAKAGS